MMQPTPMKGNLTHSKKLTKSRHSRLFIRKQENIEEVRTKAENVWRLCQKRSLLEFAFKMVGQRNRACSRHEFLPKRILMACFPIFHAAYVYVSTFPFNKVTCLAYFSYSSLPTTSLNFCFKNIHFVLRNIFFVGLFFFSAVKQYFYVNYVLK